MTRFLWIAGGLLAVLLVAAWMRPISPESHYRRNLFGVYYRHSCSLLGGDPRCSILPFAYERIVGADPWSFEAIDGSGLGRDNQFIYCVQRIDKADRATFRPLGNGLFADRNSVRHGCVLLMRQRSAQDAPENFDPATFEQLPCNFVKDATGVYSTYPGIEFGTESDTHAVFDRRVDVFRQSALFNPATFQVDAKCNVRAGGLRLIPNRRQAGPRYVVVGSTSPGDYEDLGCGYVKVKDAIFFGAEQVRGADSTTFVALSQKPTDSCVWGYFGKDQQSVWWGTWKLEGADPATFMIVPGVANALLACDKNHRYAQGHRLKEDDPNNRTYARQFAACPKG
jgi:hypothetical protein